MITEYTNRKLSYHLRSAKRILMNATCHKSFTKKRQNQFGALVKKLDQIISTSEDLMIEVHPNPPETGTVAGEALLHIYYPMHSEPEYFDTVDKFDESTKKPFGPLPKD